MLSKALWLLDIWGDTPTCHTLNYFCAGQLLLSRSNNQHRLTSLCTMHALLSITAMQAASCCSTWCTLERSCGVTICSALHKHSAHAHCVAFTVRQGKTLLLVQQCAVVADRGRLVMAPHYGCC